MTTEPPIFSGRAGLQQRVLPAYRAPFFDALAIACRDGLSVFAGKPVPGESILAAEGLRAARFVAARNRNLFPIRSPFYQCWQSGLVEWLEDWQPQVLVAEGNPRNASTRLAVRWMHARGRPVIGWGLGVPDIFGPLAPLRQPGRMAFVRMFDAWIAYSQRGADEYRRAGYPDERVFVAPNAATPRPAAPPRLRPAGFEGRPQVLFVGRLQARKRIDSLLRACAALPEPLQPELWIVGDGPGRSDFEALAQEVYPQAVFTGALQGVALDERFDRADLFVLPGTGGLAVQQAMAHALPVIVAEGDGTQGDLVRESNGWLAPPGDLPALVGVLQEALSDPARLRRMWAASYRIVSEEVNLEAMVAVFVRAMQAACSLPIWSRGI